MIIGNQNLSEIFSIFHDGVIVSHRINGDDLELEIDIQYLAERINPNFTKFFLKIHKANNFKFEAWWKDEKADHSVLSDLGIILGKEPDILSGEIKDGVIEVALNQASAECDYCGGTLSFQADSASVLDQGHKEYALIELGQICKEYWDEWDKKNKS